MSSDDQKRGKRSKRSRMRIESSGDRAVGVGGNIDHTTVVTGNVGTFNNYPPTQAASVPTLHQLPSDIADFTGRKREVSEALKALEYCDGSVVISALNGMGGIGKTTVAVHVAHQLAERFPDAQIVVDMQGMSQPLQPIEAMVEVIEAFDPTAGDFGGDINRAVRFYRNTLAGKRALILLDNAADAAQVRPLVPPAPCALILTSRRAIVLEGSRSINLDTLSEEDSRSLLRELLAKNRATDQQLDRIAELCGHLPLALRVAKSFLAVHRDWTAHEYIESLADERKRLAHLKQDDLDVEAVLELSAKQLEQENVELVLRWRMLGVIPTDFRRKTAAVVWNVAEDEARYNLSALLERSLILFDGETLKYRLHDLVRLIVRSQLSDAEEKVALERYSTTITTKLYRVHQRHADYYARVLHQANELYLQGKESLGVGLTLFEINWPAIQTGQKWAASLSNEDEEAAKLCIDYSTNGVDILEFRLYPFERVRWLEEALTATRCLERPSSECLVLTSLGLAYAELGEIRRAIEVYEQALGIAGEIGDRSVEGVALDNLGQAYAGLGEPRRAIAYYVQALSIAREIFDRRSEGTRLSKLGVVYAYLGEIRRAIAFYEEALEIAREIGDRSGEGIALGNLGQGYADLGETRRAIKLHEECLAIDREIGDRRGQGYALSNLGSAYFAMGETQLAIQFYEQCLDIAREVGDQRGEGYALSNLGAAYLDLGETKLAVEFYQQRFSIAREVGDRRGEGNALGGLGQAYFELGDAQRAIEVYEQQHAIVREIEDRRGEGNVQFNMSLVLDQLGEREQAILLAENALKIFEQLESPYAENARARLFEWRKQP